MSVYLLTTFPLRKNAARELAGRTGMTDTAARRHLDAVGAAREWRPRHRWQITPDVRDYLSVKLWHGAHFENLYDWVDGLDPQYDCD